MQDKSTFFSVLEDYPFLRPVKSRQAKLLKGAYYVGKEFDYYRFLSSLPEKEFFLSQGTYALAEQDEDICSVYTYLSGAWVCFMLHKDDFVQLFAFTDVRLETPLDVFKLKGTEITGLAQDCPSTVIIPDSVTSIGSGAFRNCGSLMSIEIPNSVTSIGERAFYYCSSLTSVTIGNGVTSIGWFAFSSCSSLESIIVSEGNPKYKSENNCLIEKTTNTLILGCKNSIIPSSVTSIGTSAFRGCRGLIGIEIPDSVVGIGDWAFYDCYHLTTVTIPDSVTRIGEYAFRGCGILTSIEIPNSVTGIGYGAFLNCGSLTTINYNGTRAEWQTIGKGAYWKDGVPSDCRVYCTDGDVEL